MSFEHPDLHPHERAPLSPERMRDVEDRMRAAVGTLGGAIERAGTRTVEEIVGFCGRFQQGLQAIADQIPESLLKAGDEALRSDEPRHRESAGIIGIVAAAHAIQKIFALRREAHA